jgi:hypothetical protein
MYGVFIFYRERSTSPILWAVTFYDNDGVLVKGWKGYPNQHKAVERT